MGTIAGMLRRIEAVNTDQICVDSITETKEAIADLNAEQMISGIRADGSPITPTYSDYTIRLKKAKGQPTDRVTLKDTGAFQAGIIVNVQGDKIITTSTDAKTEKLNKKYSKAKGNIFGLSDKYKDEYRREHLQPVFKKKIEQATGLKMGK